MTKREAAIVSLFTGVLLGKFSDMHGYAEELMGCPIFTHQFGSKEYAEELKQKCKPDFISISENLEDSIEPKTQHTTTVCQKQ